MNINEKIDLYEFARRTTGREYHNLTSKERKIVKKEFRRKSVGEKNDENNKKK